MCTHQDLKANITHCLFDLDGLLLDTETIYEEIVRDIAAKHGKPYPREVRIHILGTSTETTCKIAVDELGLPITAEEFARQFSALSRERLGKLDMLPGVERLVRHLHKHKVPMCLATSSSEDMTGIKMSSHPKLFDLFDYKVMGTDPEVKQGKPAPDIFFVAAQRFPNPPKFENCLVFEDSPNGVRAACLAGMQSVMVPDDMVANSKRKDATIVFHSLADFKPEQFGLPPFDDEA